MPGCSLLAPTFAIISLLTGLCTWYRPGGRLTRDAIIAAHEKLVLSGVAPHAAIGELRSGGDSPRTAVAGS